MTLAPTRAPVRHRFQPIVRSVSCAALLSVATGAFAQIDPASPWGARAPARCDGVKPAGTPTPAQVKQLLRCTHEQGSASSGELWLMEDLAVEIGSGQPFKAFYNTYTMADADTSKPVHPIRGSYTWSVCMLRKDAVVARRDPDQNCRETAVNDAKGVCWRTAFGDWRCSMTGRSGETRTPTRPRSGA
ncbi:hypothetical protein ABXN37_13830 [Piscinibacter sakaiensis]|uniref:Uncharacterized protein n=1 Tax=Piscinibacter sakaiensis TaxID=1547922 RepID=A0A0K8P0S2_PISS1|nr:hypothetical protein [Piscinibacter sakaiensis]GAP36228.1 hypothetical protein ISF6_2068 [Piscinibacter sakaiensis]